jgi:hypothetical protein
MPARGIGAGYGGQLTIPLAVSTINIKLIDPASHPKSCSAAVISRLAHRI